MLTVPVLYKTLAQELYDIAKRLLQECDVSSEGYKLSIGYENRLWTLDYSHPDEPECVLIYVVEADFEKLIPAFWEQVIQAARRASHIGTL